MPACVAYLVPVRPGVRAAESRAGTWVGGPLTGEGQGVKAPFEAIPVQGTSGTSRTGAKG